MPTNKKNLIFVDKDKVCKYKKCCNYPTEDVGYNWLNYSFPVGHKHDHWEVLLVTQGSLLHEINGERLQMFQGDFYLVRADDFHSIHFTNENAKCRHMTFSIKLEYIKKLFDVYSETDFQLYEKFNEMASIPKCTLPQAELQKITNTILNIRSIKMPFKEKITHIKYIVNRLIGLLVEQDLSSKTFPDWLTDFLFFLGDPYNDIKNVEDLSANTPYSYTRLSTLFKQYTGRTIIEYVTRIKMNQAEELLRYSDLSVTEIAYKLHYESMSHFIRTFKKEFGMTPSEHKKITQLVLRDGKTAQTATLPDKT